MDYRCLNCNNEWEAKIIDPSLGWRQCGKCRSYDIIESNVYSDIIKDVTKLDADGHLRLQVLREIIKKRGFRFRPISTLNLVEKVLDDVFPKMTAAFSITGDGRVHYQKKRVKKEKKE